MCIAGRPVSDKAFFLACLGVFAAGSLASWGRVYALAMATAGVAEKLRTRLFAALLLQEKEFFDERKAGELAPILAEVRAPFCFRRRFFLFFWGGAVEQGELFLLQQGLRVSSTHLQGRLLCPLRE